MNYTSEINFLLKSLNDSNRLNYFKRELLKILDAKEKQENTVSKAIDCYFNSVEKSVYGIDFLEKGRLGTVGEIRTWKDGKRYKKMPNGNWIRVYQQQNRSAEISISRLKGKVKKAQSVDELMNIVMNNIHRFEDENGKILPIVEELKKEVNASKGKINSGKPSVEEQIENLHKKNNNEFIDKPDFLNGKWNGKIYGNEKYGYSIYVDNKKVEINSEEKKQLEDYAAKKAEYSKNAMKEKRNETIRNDIVNIILRNIGARERDIDELNKFLSILSQKNLPEKQVSNFVKREMGDARTERYNSSDLIQSDYQSYIENINEYELKILSDITRNELEKIKIQKQKELDEEKAKEKAKKEYEEKLLSDDNFRKEEENKKIKERTERAEKQRKQESRIREIAGDGYWNGIVYGSARYGYSVYVSNKKYTIPEKDYDLFDLKK